MESCGFRQLFGGHIWLKGPNKCGLLAMYGGYMAESRQPHSLLFNAFNQDSKVKLRLGPYSLVFSSIGLIQGQMAYYFAYNSSSATAFLKISRVICVTLLTNETRKHNMRLAAHGLSGHRVALLHSSHEKQPASSRVLNCFRKAG